MADPKVSVIMPCFNGEAYLEEAIFSIKRQNMDVEIIVVDDKSIDLTADIARENFCRVIRNERNVGPITSRNIGMRHARGEFILFHDQDDILCDEALPHMHGYFVKNEELAVIFSKRKDFFSPDIPSENFANVKIKEDAYYGALAGTALLRASFFQGVDIFDDKMDVTAGEALFLKDLIEQMGLRCEKIDFTSALRRIHNNNYSRSNQMKERKDFSKILRSKLQRKNI